MRLLHFFFKKNSSFFSVPASADEQVFALSVLFVIFFFPTTAHSNRGDVIMVMVLIYSLLGSVAGYVAARLLVCVGVKRWKDIFSLAVAFPAFVCMVYHSNLSLQTSRIKFAPSFEAYCFGVFFWYVLHLVVTCGCMLFLCVAVAG